MMIPVRCFSCGKVLADSYEEFQKRVEKGEKADKVLDELGITKYCCRRIILAQADIIEEIMKYNV